MKNRFLTYGLLAAAAVAMFAVTLMPLSAQLGGAAKDAAPGDAKAAAKGGGKGGGKGKGAPKGGPTPRIGTLTLNQPDFGGPGMWSVPYITNMSGSITEGGVAAPCPTFQLSDPTQTPTPSCAPFNEHGKEVFARRRKTDSATDPEGFCLPPGVPRMMYTPYPMKIIQTPDTFTFIFEGGAHVWREIPVAPKGWLTHQANFNPSYLGDSFGWWEGDTMVIDSVGFNDRTWLDFAGHPHGEKLHVIERFTRLDALTLEHIATIEDPDFYTQPWTVRITTGYQPTGKILEYICQENESDSKHQLEYLKKLGITRESIP
ncbi:MAG: hypothetical protein ABI995_10030 [Acidobacteriota bacterium]